MSQSPLSLVVPIVDGQIESLRAVLKVHEAALLQALSGLGNVHYARWVIIDASKTYPAQLAFESNFDGEIDPHINELVAALGGLIDQIYRHCKGFSPGANAAYLKSIRIREAAFYQGSPGRTVKTIAGEKALRSRLVREVEAGQWSGQSARQIHEALQKQVLSEENFAWAKEQLATPGINWLVLILGGIALVAISPLLVIWAIYMQFFHELRETPGTITPNDVSDAQSAAYVGEEDFSYQNQFSQIMELKAGWARLLTVKALLLLTRALSAVLFVHGKLMGIPTIHFARWAFLDNNRRMLFFSNFDGSWRQYLGDFIDKSGWGLNGIFGNTQTFPRIWFLLLKGAYDEMHFLGWSRSTQIPTQVWFAATVDQSIKNINDNTLIRNDLSRTLDEDAARLFLSRL
jgi:hypothetical protein